MGLGEGGTTERPTDRKCVVECRMHAYNIIIMQQCVSARGHIIIKKMICRVGYDFFFLYVLQY